MTEEIWLNGDFEKDYNSRRMSRGNTEKKIE